MKIRDHIIPQITLFKYLESVIQNDKIERNVNHHIQVGWLAEMEKCLINFKWHKGAAQTEEFFLYGKIYNVVIG